MAQPDPVRYVLERLNGTPTQELPHIANFLANSIANRSATIQIDSRANAANMHKLKTKLSSLLQDRSTEGRFSAVVLIKALLEALGIEGLAACEPWARNLVTNLNKNDPPKIKALYLACITRIFLLTRDQPYAHREITTALSPAFINACFNLIRPKTTPSVIGQRITLSPLLKPVLACWIQLLPANPATFRPFVARFKSIAVHLITDATTPKTTAALACQLLAIVHISAPQTTSGDQWLQMCNDALTSAHRLSDELFRNLDESWQYRRPEGITRNRGSAFEAGEVSLQMLQFSPNMGIDQGAHCVQSLLQLIANLCCLPSTQSDAIPLGAILDLSGRLTSIVPTSSLKASRRTSTQINPAETGSAWNHIPDIHLACLQLLCSLVQSYKQTLLPVWRNIWEQLHSVYTTSVCCGEVREAIYSLLAQLLPFIGSALDKQDLRVCSQLISHCCQDYLAECSAITRIRSDKRSPTSKPDHVYMGSLNDPVTTASSPKGETEARLVRTSLEGPSHKLLTALLVHVPAGTMSYAMRTEIDRAILLVEDKTAILASTLNPPRMKRGRRAAPSLMPFLARLATGDLATEALLHPRMPVLAPVEMSDMEADGEDATILDGSVSYTTDPSDNVARDKSQALESLTRNNEETQQPVMDVSSSVDDLQPQNTVPQKRDLGHFLQDDTKEAQAKRACPITEPNGTGNVIGKDRVEIHHPELERTMFEDRTENYQAEGGISPDDYADARNVPIATVLNATRDKTASPVVQREFSPNAINNASNQSSDSDIPSIDAELDTEDDDDT